MNEKIYVEYKDMVEAMEASAVNNWIVLSGYDPGEKKGFWINYIGKAL